MTLCEFVSVVVSPGYSLSVSMNDSSFLIVLYCIVLNCIVYFLQLRVIFHCHCYGFRNEVGRAASKTSKPPSVHLCVCVCVFRGLILRLQPQGARGGAFIGCVQRLLPKTRCSLEMNTLPVNYVFSIARVTTVFRGDHKPAVTLLYCVFVFDFVGGKD